MSKLKELQTEKKIRELLEKERQVANRLYAAKLVERIVFGFIALMLIAFANAMFGLVIK